MTTRGFHEGWTRTSCDHSQIQAWSFDPCEGSNWEAVVSGNDEAGWDWQAEWPAVVKITCREANFWRALEVAEGVCSGVPQRQAARLP